MIKGNTFNRIFIQVRVCLLLLFVSCIGLRGQQSPDGIWHSLDESATAAAGSQAQRSVPEPAKNRRAYAVNRPLLEAVLAATPLESNRQKRASMALYLPLPTGEFAPFELVETPVMAPGLAAKYPHIKTYRGAGLEDPSATVRISQTPLGIHAQIRGDKGMVYIDPRRLGDQEQVVSYFAKDSRRGAVGFSCLTKEIASVTASGAGASPASTNLSPSPYSAQVTDLQSGTEIRTYRIACAATAEYTAAVSPSGAGTLDAVKKEYGLAAIVQSINRVNGIFEVELAIRLVLVDGNEQLIFVDPEEDPYSNDDVIAMLDENQKTIDAVIGNANYDIGHVFAEQSYNNGVASLSVVGKTGLKARGVSAQTFFGDSYHFDVDYLAHEIGHQFAALHTFNGIACSNVSFTTAYEPGSGSSIMSYAGVCGEGNLQRNSDPYFHSISFEQIINFVDNLMPSVGERTATGNHVPSVDAGDDYIIPARTPFVLTATASDPDQDDRLTYCWEQRDLGPQQGVNAGDNGESPLFRSWLPTASAARTFPRLSDLVDNTTATGETLPTTTRTLNFTVTVRDNNSAGGGVRSDGVTLQVVDAGTSFEVTVPNRSVNWSALGQHRVTWDVAGTNANGIDTPHVAITLSTDGGMTYPHTLLATTPNDGAAWVILPDTPTTRARIRVQGKDNIFFDISDVDFTILPAEPGFQLRASTASDLLCNQDTAMYGIEVVAHGGFDEPVQLTANHLPAGVTATFTDNPLLPGNRTSLLLNHIGAAKPGVVESEIIGTTGAGEMFVQPLTLELHAAVADVLQTPANLAIAVELLPQFNWRAMAGADTYVFEIAEDLDFASLVYSQQTSNTYVWPDVPLEPARVYFWRVSADTPCGRSVTPTFNFATEAVDPVRLDSLCQIPEQSVAIADNDANGVSRSITTALAGVITDLDVSLDIDHPWVGDLTVILANETTGIEAKLVVRPGYPGSVYGFQGNGLNIRLDDEAAASVENPTGDPSADDVVYEVGASYQPNEPLSSFAGLALAGTWTLTVIDAAQSHSGTLNGWCLTATVDYLSPVESWLDRFGLSFNELGSDLDADGLLALQEYAFNLDPTLGENRYPYDPETTSVHGPSGLPHIEVVGIQPHQHLQVTFPRRTAVSKSGIGYKVYFSQDLQTWTEHPVLEQHVTGINRTWEQVTLKDPIDLAAAPDGRRFVVVDVVLDPQ